MKIKTSITLSEEVLRQMDRLMTGNQSRSEFIETAVLAFLQQIARNRRDAKDLAIINRRAARLNREAEDVLGYQIDA